MNALGVNPKLGTYVDGVRQELIKVSNCTQEERERLLWRYDSFLKAMMHVNVTHRQAAIILMQL